jgi:hypothetical protein
MMHTLNDVNILYSVHDVQCTDNLQEKVIIKIGEFDRDENLRISL